MMPSVVFSLKAVVRKALALCVAIFSFFTLIISESSEVGGDELFFLGKFFCVRYVPGSM